MGMHDRVASPGSVHVRGCVGGMKERVRGAFSSLCMHDSLSSDWHKVCTATVQQPGGKPSWLDHVQSPHIRDGGSSL